MKTPDALLAQIQISGLLLQHDSVLLSLTTLVAEAPIAGSWWSHSQAHQIYGIINSLAAHPDMLVVKLVRGKATFLHRRLWPALLGVACGRESWQFNQLSDAARDLYAAVKREGMLRAVGAAPKELERRLLVQSGQVHTERGHHELLLTAWSLWAKQVGCELPVPASVERLQLEMSVQAIGGTLKMLPWHAKARGK